ncbi:MAG: lipocalin-like domain-containing protein [Bacteroidaceae bacterium]|jgi:hypothetical protein|nr:lipocalin-like domain-containing protein [Bacteroidaceae bacterium]
MNPKKNIILTSIILLCAIFCSCESKHNTNGDFNGNWQLISWKNNEDGREMCDTNNRIYYAVSLNLIKIWQPNNAAQYLSEFILTSDSLKLTKTYAFPFDSIVSFDLLKNYGVSADGAFKIEKNNSKSLILSNRDNTLTFRRY